MEGRPAVDVALCQDGWLAADAPLQKPHRKLVLLALLDQLVHGLVRQWRIDVNRSGDTGHRWGGGGAVWTDWTTSTTEYYSRRTRFRTRAVEKIRTHTSTCRMALASTSSSAAACSRICSASIGRPLMSLMSSSASRWASTSIMQSTGDHNTSTNASSGIYMDNQATTPLDPRVLDKMMPYLTTHFGNPHSTTHAHGWRASAAVEQAREQVAGLVGADAKEIVFTSGATESNNTAIKGVPQFYKESKRHIITVTTEHKCVLNSARAMEDAGFDVTYLPVQANGIVDLEELRRAIRPDTALVSVMAVNNEIGVIQPIAEIGAICRDNGVFFHSDAAQAIGKIPIDVEAMNIDLLSISGHKLYGPKGIGALYVRRKNPRVHLTPLISGGGQERNIRSGTVPTFLSVGLGAACDIAGEEMLKDHLHVSHLSNMLRNGLMSRLPRVTMNGDPEHRVPHNLNLSFDCVEGESLMLGLKDVSVSSGSACTSVSLEPSYVLRALGIEESLAHTSIRFGIGRFTTMEEIRNVEEQVVRAVERLRELSPLWEMIEEGLDPTKVQWVDPREDGDDERLAPERDLAREESDL